MCNFQTVAVGLSEGDYVYPGLSNNCWCLMQQFLLLCKKLNIYIATEKIVWPCTCLTYLGYQLNSVTFEIKMPEDKVQHTLRLIERALALRGLHLRKCNP